MELEQKYFDFFQNYSNHYMRLAGDEFQRLHIHRKIEHSKRVYQMAVEIAKKLELKDQEIHLVGIAALFHDIGRFEQFYRFNTYKDSDACHHAFLGVEILEKEKILDDLDDLEKSWILEIIKVHDDEEIPRGLPQLLSLYLSIVRDADKLDWIYAMINIIPKLSEKDQAVFYSNKEDRPFISQSVVNSVLNDKVISHRDVTTIDELRAAAMGWMTSLIQCSASYEIVKNHGFLEAIYQLMGDEEEKHIIYHYIKQKISN